MLSRVASSGARASSSTPSICWRCLLEREFDYRPFRSSVSRHRKSTNSEKKAESTSENSTAASPSKSPKQKQSRSQTKSAVKEANASTQDGATDTKPAQDPGEAHRSSTTRKEAKVSTTQHDAKSASDKEAQQQRKSMAREHHAASKKSKARRIKSSLNIRRIPTNGKIMVKPQKGRSRIQRHLASAQRRSRPDDVEEGEEDGQSLKSAMQGKTFEDGGGGPERVSFKTKDLTVDVINRELGFVPRLAHGLQRVLFHRGVVQFRDLHSRVYNFDPSLELLPPVDKVDFKSLTRFTPPSKDKTLAEIAKTAGKKYVGSTSSLTGLLKHFHFLLSKHRDLNFRMMSTMNENPPTMSKITKSPDAVFLKYRDGMYSVDADKEHDSPNVLSLMGTYLEKYFTADKSTFEKFKVGNKAQLTKEDLGADAYHYSTVDDFLMRSQLDAYDPRLPGTGMFDLKTRAVLPIRMDNKNFEWGMDYEIHRTSGMFSSYEREMTDMARATMLKYSLQARIGRMDGIFVAYHNIARVFGFQYIPIDEMDHILHGQEDRCLGDQEFVASMHLLNELVGKATERFPEQSLRIHVDMPKTESNHSLFFFAEPVTDDQINEIQNRGKEDIEDWERELLGYDKHDDATDAPPKGSKSIFVDLASETDKFRARARKIADDRKLKRQAAAAASSDEEAQNAGTVEKSSKITELLAEFGLKDLRHGQEAKQDQTIEVPHTPVSTTPESVSPKSDPSHSEPAASGSENANTQSPNTDSQSELGKILTPSESPSKEASEGEKIRQLSDREPKEAASETNGQVLNAESQQRSQKDGDDAVNEAAAAYGDDAAKEAAAAEAAAAAKKAEDAARRAKRKAELEELEKKPLMGLQLRITNSINGRTRLRPMNLKPKDEWKIAFSVTEVTEPERKWRMYDQTMRKRKALLKQKEREERAQKRDYFLEVIKKATKEGGSWRKQRDKLDRLKEEGDEGVHLWDREEPVERGQYKVLSKEAAS